MSNLVYQVQLQVEAALRDGAAQCRRGHSELGCLNPASPAGEAFAAAYDTWMVLRARFGDQFALSLGYGHNHA